MSDLSYRLEGENVAAICNASPSDFVQLLKPRVMSLVVFSALAGILLAPGHVHPVIGFASLLAIAVGAGAAGALNMWYDADIDAVMIRTRGRPIPSGRIDRDLALGFGLTLAAFSVVTLGLVANWLAAALLAFTIFFYIVDLFDVAEAHDAAEHRHRRRRRRAATDRRLCRGDWLGQRCERRSLRRSSSCGRHHISGRWRWSNPAIMPAPASQ